MTFNQVPLARPDCIASLINMSTNSIFSVWISFFWSQPVINTFSDMIFYFMCNFWQIPSNPKSLQAKFKLKYKINKLVLNLMY